MLDVFFISYDEPYADQNFEKLREIAPHAKRVHGVTGIFEAHKECAKLSRTTHLYVVDADCLIDDKFEFDFIPRKNVEVWSEVVETDCVFTWRSRNPINDLLYGYGAVKLFPRDKLLNATHWKVDMTTTIGCPFVPKFQISNVTAFNTDPFNTWKSAFRECTKLASAIIPNSDNVDNEYRLQIWKTRGSDRPFGKYAIDGANQGADFGTHYKNNIAALNMINDFEWLKAQFELTYGGADDE
jgi:hypothetical protein